MDAFEKMREALAAEGAEVIVASTDDRERAEDTAASLGLGFPVGFGLPLHDTAASLGAFFEERRNILHATGFLIRPGGEIAVAVYSSGAIGRLEPGEVLRLLEFERNRDDG